MRLQKSTIYKRHNGFINEMLNRGIISKKFWFIKKHDFCFKKDHWMKSINDVFYHTWASHCVVGVGKDSGMGLGKDSGMVHEWVSSHFMA